MRGPLGPVIGRYPSSDGNARMGDGIIKHNRKCRDVVFLVIFIAFCVAMIVNSSFGFNQENPLITSELRNTSLQLQGPCYPVIFPSVNVYWSCQFIARALNVSLRHWQKMGGVSIVEDMVIDKSIHQSINSRSAVLKRYVADVGKSWPVLIVCGGILPLFLSIIWLLMIRHFVTGMPWITVVLFNILIVSVTMFYYLKAGWLGNDAISPIIGEHDPYYHVSAREVSHLHAAAALMTVVMVVAILSSIAIVRRILMATSVLKANKIPGLHIFMHEYMS